MIAHTGSRMSNPDNLADGDIGAGGTCDETRTNVWTSRSTFTSDHRGYVNHSSVVGQQRET